MLFVVVLLCFQRWWLRFSAAIPAVKRVLSAGVIRPPGDPGKPTNGSKKALDAWRNKINEARSRLTPGKQTLSDSFVCSLGTCVDFLVIFSSVCVLVCA